MPFRSGRRRQGFTLMELLLVIAIIAILAGLGVSGYQFANIYAAKSKTKAQMASLKLALEEYHKLHGEYPKPATERASDAATEWLGGTEYKLGGAQVLYQALSADGSDKLDLGSASTAASDGEIDETEEENLVMKELDPQSDTTGMVKVYQGDWVLIDGFGNPWQYRHGSESGAINKGTYDLWSFGDAEDASSGEASDIHWIRNW